jgi:hypothetical protein
LDPSARSTGPTELFPLHGADVPLQSKSPFDARQFIGKTPVVITAITAMLGLEPKA